MLEVEAGAWDELQPGSYIFMDVDYGKNEWAPPLPRFQQSLFVLTTVMSTPAPDRVIVDAGLKASSVDSGMPAVWQRQGYNYARASDEHGLVEIAPSAKAPRLGELVTVADDGNGEFDLGPIELESDRWDEKD